MEVKFSYTDLKGRIDDMYGSQRNFSKVVNLSETSVSSKLNSKSAFTDREIVYWCRLLKIELHEVNRYFFTIQVKQV